MKKLFLLLLITFAPYPAYAQNIIFADSYAGVDNTGAADSTTGIQNAENARESGASAALAFQGGTYKVSGITIDRQFGGGWQCLSRCRFIPTGSSVTFLTLSNAVCGTSEATFILNGFTFDSNGSSSVSGISETSPCQTTLTNLSMVNLLYAVVFTGPNSAAQMGNINISNVYQYGTGEWLFRGYGTTSRTHIFNININNFIQNGTGSSAWSADRALFYFSEAVNAFLSNISVGSLDGAAAGLVVVGDAEGIFVTNMAVAWPTIGILSQADTTPSYPAYVYLTNVGIDQFSDTGIITAGNEVGWKLVNDNVTNGAQRSNSGSGIQIAAGATDFQITNVSVINNEHTGISLGNGVALRMSGMTFANNHQISGWDVDFGTNTWDQAALDGTNTSNTGANAISIRQGSPAIQAGTCGSGYSAVTGSDLRGHLTTGSGSTACTLIFSRGFTSVPNCVATSQTAVSTFAYTPTTTGIAFTNGASDTINYSCTPQSVE